MLTRVRDELEEDTAEEWETTTLTRYINDEHKVLMQRLGQIPEAGWGEATETFTVAGSTETYDLSGLAQTLGAIRTINHVPSSGYEIRCDFVSESQFNDLRLNSTEVPAEVTPSYSLRRTAGTEYLHFLPLASGTRTFRINYRYVPATLTSGEDLHTPERYDDLLAAMVKRRGLAKVGESDDALEMYIARRTAEMEDAEGAAASESVAPRIPSEFSAELFGN